METKEIWGINLFAFAIPFFLALMAVEYFVAKKKKISYGKFFETVSNLSVGIFERFTDIIVAGVFYFIYDFIQVNYGIFKIIEKPYTWLLLFIFTDFVWYWYHRLAHELNLLWALHIVHHQSTDFNYTVSARITVFQAFARTIFWSVLALIGFKAPMITCILILHGLYPFFVHTQTIGKLGIFELVFVTPSHHRVHHASNEEYLDKNYGEVLIIWDKIFGTFKQEEATIKTQYGLTNPLKSHSFLWIHFHYIIELLLAIKNSNGITSKLKILFGKPKYIDNQYRNLAEYQFQVKQNNSQLNKKLAIYIVSQLFICCITLFVFVLIKHQLNSMYIVLIAAFILFTLINCGAILEKKEWAFQVELLRIYTVLILVGFTFSPYILLSSLVISSSVLIKFKTLKSKYLLLMYS